MSDVVSTWQEIGAQVTPWANKDQEKYWKACQRYSATWKIDPFLHGCDQLNIIIIVTDVSEGVRQGYYSKGVKIKIPTVAKAALSIDIFIHLVGKSCPFKTME